ncbi:MAG: glycolate oxidase subunit GlcF [Pseudomonadota bacterium]
MQTSLADFIRNSDVGEEADSILRSCVHCGFCNATCPTYQVLGNELDGPRGRIYLIKQVLEGEPVTDKTQTHLDRCLTCRNCETTCPSGVRYGQLVDIGRKVVEERVGRPWLARLQRFGIRKVFASPGLVRLGLAMARPLKRFLPPRLRGAIPDARSAGRWPSTSHPRTMVVLSGCVQSAAAPQINVAAARILDRLGIALTDSPASGCCGALEFHLNRQDIGLDRAKANIDAWVRELDAGAEAIVMTASGCGAMVKEYAHLLRHDSEYRDKANRVVAATKDLLEVLDGETLDALSVNSESIAFHAPCTLQHGQKLAGLGERVMRRLGFSPLPFTDNHLCCGSAGSYSLLNPELAGTLRARKVAALEATKTETIVTANIGCLMHLQAGTELPVRHWAETLAERLSD